MKRKIIVISLLILGVSSLLLGFAYQNKVEVERKNKLEKEAALRENETKKKIKEAYSENVVISKEINLYKLENKKYIKSGKAFKNVIFNLEDNDNLDGYYKIKNSDYYLYYTDFVETTNTNDDRYSNYIYFPSEITTKEDSKFYNSDGVEVFTLKDGIKLQVLENLADSYGVVLFDRLVFIKKNSISSVDELKDTAEVAEQVPVLNYHFIYLEGESCDEMICHPESQINEQFAYLSANKVFTLTTKELGQFISGEIRLPKKSILLTIDDGARAEKFIPFLEKYKINATLFLVSSWYPKETFTSNYLELASHTHDMHTNGVCPMGQGGGIRCLSEDKIQADLKASRETLNNTEAFCYPFYEYNDYAVEQVKKAGFKLAFIGGNKMVTKDTNPYLIPRYVIYKNTGLGYLKNLLN
mgnify:FL=1